MKSKDYLIIGGVSVLAVIGIFLIFKTAVNKTIERYGDEVKS